MHQMLLYNKVIFLKLLSPLASSALSDVRGARTDQHLSE